MLRIIACWSVLLFLSSCQSQEAPYSSVKVYYGGYTLHTSAGTISCYRFSEVIGMLDSLEMKDDDTLKIIHQKLSELKEIDSYCPTTDELLNGPYGHSQLILFYKTSKKPDTVCINLDHQVYKNYIYMGKDTSLIKIIDGYFSHHTKPY